MLKPALYASLVVRHGAALSQQLLQALSPDEASKNHSRAKKIASFVVHAWAHQHLLFRLLIYVCDEFTLCVA